MKLTGTINVKKVRNVELSNQAKKTGQQKESDADQKQKTEGNTKSAITVFMGCSGGLDYGNIGTLEGERDRKSQGSVSKMAVSKHRAKKGRSTCMSIGSGYFDRNGLFRQKNWRLEVIGTTQR